MSGLMVVSQFVFGVVISIAALSFRVVGKRSFDKKALSSGSLLFHFLIFRKRNIHPIQIIAEIAPSPPIISCQ
jgi:hypothetical protein